MNKILFTFTILIFISYSCDKQENATHSSFDDNITTETTYTQIPVSQSNVDFVNQIDAGKTKPPLRYINVFNGGGVALGDINNDGLVDMYFTGNLSDNKLYLNKGEFEFEDITQKAGVACKKSWSTGVTMADVNNDGWLDIYVCRSYEDDPQKRKNQLFINNKDLTFSEMSDAYGLGDIGYSIQASFFDYDKDGLLDLFVGNHPASYYQSTAAHFKNWHNPILESSDHLFHNEGNGKFSNATTKAGVLNYGWTLGMVTVDLNQDDWSDIYVTVDHTEPDRVYINNKDGTFSESSLDYFKHTSLSSMGIDAGDVNNDGLVDLVTAEMLPFDNFREKTQMAGMNSKKFWDYVIAGYNYQYMRNMLQLNNGNGTFRETGQLANIHHTDWSWSVLFMDMDNDGFKDLFITNGYFKDYSSKDYQLNFSAEMDKAVASNNDNEKIRLFNAHGLSAPPNKLPNFMYKNNGNQTFENFSQKSGLDKKGFSNGAAYADLDNDGDLDIVVNNINEKAFIFQNKGSDNNWLRIKLSSGIGKHSIGTKIWLETESGSQFQEHTLTRGYQSSVEETVHFGVGKAESISMLRIKWPDGKQQILKDVKPNQLLTVTYDDAKITVDSPSHSPKLFVDATKSSGIDYTHEEVYCPDYDKQILLPHQMSCFGPGLSVADINGDGLQDFFVGGAQDHSGAIYLQNKKGEFIRSNEALLQKESKQEDLGAVFFDADGDGDQDLYVTSGGNERDDQDAYYTDRFYLNDGKGNFTKAGDRIPTIKESGSCVKPFDYDGDGDLDLFVGSRHVPGKYPLPPRSYLLENNKGHFKDVTATKAPFLMKAGMVTDATWADVNNDGKTDLFIVGEWMPLTFLIQKNGVFEEDSKTHGLSNTTGWWNGISSGDYDGDGDIDYIIGNLGLNYKYKSDLDAPFQVYAADFDKNGSSDIVLGYINNSTLFPVRGRQCSSEQIPDIAVKFPNYDGFGKASLEEVYGDGLDDALHYSIHTFASSILINNGDGKYTLTALPAEAQSSPVNSIISKDFDNDGHLDLLMAGNLYVSEVETGRADSGIGFFLKGDGTGRFETFYFNDSGFFTPEDVKHLEMIETANGKKYILVANNHSKFRVIEWRASGQIQ